jgi:hypothetical protein
LFQRARSGKTMAYPIRGDPLMKTKAAKVDQTFTPTTGSKIFERRYWFNHKSLWKRRLRNISPHPCHSVATSSQARPTFSKPPNYKVTIMWCRWCTKHPQLLILTSPLVIHLYISTEIANTKAYQPSNLFTFSRE